VTSEAISRGIIKYEVKHMAAKTFDQVLEEVENLPVDQQADLVEVVRRRLAARGRRRVIQEVREGLAQYQDGKTKAVSADQIMREIES
jgi:hypothetical protein